MKDGGLSSQSRVAPPAGPTIEPIPFVPRKPVRRRRARFPAPRRLAAFGLILLLAAAAGFVFTARTVRFEIEPVPDTIGVEGGLAFELGGRYLMRPGSYLLRAEKEGFRVLETSFEVSREATQSLAFTLDRLPGILRLAVGVRPPAGGPDATAERPALDSVQGSPDETEVLTPLDGAIVFVDGEPVGATPLDAFELAPGGHGVRVVAERHLPFEATVEITGAGEEHELIALLEPDWAPVSFRTEPAGARLRIDGEERAKTPATVEVASGRRGFELILAGYKPRRGQLDITANQPHEMPLMRLEPSDGNLLVTSRPEGATVTVDGAYRGTTPLDLELSPGAYAIRLSKAGFAAVDRQHEVHSGQAGEIDVVLEAQLGEVRLTLFPPDAELYIDDMAADVGGNGPSRTLRLPAVEHRFEVRKAGYASARRAITPLPGHPQALEITLDPIAVAKEKATPDELKVAGHTLRRVLPGRFLMGASRREPGRRANEALREVEITRGFFLGTHEVTNAQFRRFTGEHDSGLTNGSSLNADGQPVVRVTWQQAAAYCNWLSEQEGLPKAYVERDGELVAAEPLGVGYRLPTEAEWAWAARYDAQGSAARKYPWGDRLPVPPGAGNYADSNASSFVAAALTDYDDAHAVSAPVGSYAADRRGFYDLGGNAAEWMHDVYVLRPSQAGGLEADPIGRGGGPFHVIRGASYLHGSITELRLTFRDYSEDARSDVGFRIARFIDVPSDSRSQGATSSGITSSSTTSIED